jgi:hypothetical protein
MDGWPERRKKKDRRTTHRRCYWLSIAAFQLFVSQTIRVYIMKKGTVKLEKFSLFSQDVDYAIKIQLAR